MHLLCAGAWLCGADRTYVMYHGTRPAAADAIERWGFSRSRDGMLGEGVYLSRDVTKAAHYPLDVASDDYENRVILECESRGSEAAASAVCARVCCHDLTGPLVCSAQALCTWARSSALTAPTIRCKRRG